MDTDLADRLDRSIGPAPEGSDQLADVLAQGQRVVRRRRLAGATASVAAVLVVVGGAALATGGDTGRAAPPVSGTPTVAAPTASTSAAATPAPAPTAWEWGEDLAAYDVALGEVVVKPGATVLQRIENPYDLTPPAGSAALVVASAKGVRYWYVFTWDDGGSASAGNRADQADGPFRRWVEELRSLSESGDQPPSPTEAPPPQGKPADDLVRFVGDTEELVASGGATVVEQRPGVDLGEDFAAPDDRTAAGVVRTASGDQLFVLVRAATGEPAQAISVPVGPVAGQDLDAFLVFARDAYASGGGLL